MKLKLITLILATLSFNFTYSQGFLDKFKKSSKPKEESKEKPLEEKKPEKPLAVPPKTQYNDVYGISGVYYLSKEMIFDENFASPPDQRYFSQVSFQFDTTKQQLLIHFHEGKEPIKAFIEGLVVKGLKTGAANFDYLPFSINNVSRVFESIIDGELRWDNRIIYPLEKDVYIINNYGYGVIVADDCSSANFFSEEGKNKKEYVILGKNKVRVEELNANPALLESLYIASCIEQCELYNRCRASSNTLPVETLKDAKLKAEALAFAKAEQANSTRNEKVEYAYIAGKDWNYTRHIKTGVIIKRSIRTITIVKIGVKCAYENGVITQNYDGAKYGPSIWGGNGAPIITDCKEAYKYK